MTGNVLITSAAAKVLLVEAFRVAAAGARQVFAADLHADIPARFAADGFIALKRSDAPDFVTDLLTACEAHGVTLVVPTRDGELGVLAEARNLFRSRGITIHVAPSGTIGICRDKRLFSAFCARHGLPCLPHLDLDEARAALPVYVRPVGGAGGDGARKIETPAALAALEPVYDGYVVNRLVPPWHAASGRGAKEYTVDLLRSLDGAVTVGAVVRERITVAGGESQHGRVVDRPGLEAVARAAGDALGLVGHNTVQLFDCPDDGPLLIEVNPRFGGAANLGIRAGLDSPRRLLRMLEGDPAALVPPRIRHGMEMFRYKRDILVDSDGRLLDEHP